MRSTFFPLAAVAMALVLSAVACGRQDGESPQKPAAVATGDAVPPAAAKGDATASGAETAPEPAVIASIEPGTKIDVKALPTGKHIVFRSRPQITSGDVTKVGKSIRDALHNYVTLVLVETEPAPEQAGRFRRAALRIGIGKPGETGDTVFTKDTAKQLGISLGLFDRKVITAREEELATVRSPGTSATMAMFDYGMVFRREEKRVPITVRYLALVDPASGDVETLYWVLDSTPEGHRFFGDTVVVMPKNHVMDWEMHVDGSEVTFGAPSADAFTSTKLPEGKPIPATAEFKSVAAARAYGPAAGARLEIQARELLKAASAAK